MAILAAVDVDENPERPIAVGYDLATAYDDRLVAMHVVPEDDFVRNQDEREELPSEYDDEYTVGAAENSAARRVTEALEATLEEFDPERIAYRGEVGEPAEEILAAADEIDPRYVVVGGRERSPARQAVFGSVSQSIVRNADRPVVTIVERTD